MENEMEATDVTQWSEELWAILPVSDEAKDDLITQWRAHANKPSLKVFIYGAYDAGKSSLLKRLLVDGGFEVPPWLTISGRRETFEVSEVEAGQLTYVDSPGLGSSNVAHDDITLVAMALADAYLWVLPPQLVTAARETYLRFLSGGWFSDRLPTDAVTRATIAVVARMDESGIDPAYNLAGYKQLCGRKSQELEAFLKANKIVPGVRAIHCVAADPFQTVGNTLSPDRDLYDSGREWDCVRALQESLESLQSEFADLRALAGARYVAYIAQTACEEILAQKGELVDDDARIDKEITRHELRLSQLSALQGQAAADLDRLVEDELLSAIRTASDSAATTSRLTEGLDRAFGQWWNSSYQNLRNLASQVQCDLKEEKPSQARADGDSSDSEDEGPEKRSWVGHVLSGGRRLWGLGPRLRKAFGVYARYELGMSLDQAAKKLNELKKSAEGHVSQIEAARRKAGFRSAQHAASASKLVGYDRLMDAFGPVITELGSLMFDVGDQLLTTKRAQENAERRKALRETLREKAEALKATASKPFLDDCARLSDVLTQRIQSYRMKQSSVKDAIDENELALIRVARKLREFPLTACHPRSRDGHRRP